MADFVKEQTNEEMMTDDNLDEAVGGYDWEKADLNKMIELFKIHGNRCTYCGEDAADGMGHGPEGYFLYECGGCGREYLGRA